MRQSIDSGWRIKRNNNSCKHSVRQYYICDEGSARQVYRLAQRHWPAHRDCWNIFPIVHSELSGKSKQKLGLEYQRLKIWQREQNRKLICILFSALSFGACDRLANFSGGGHTIELAVREFADAQLQDPDLITMHKWVKEQKLNSSEEISGLKARAKELPEISNQIQPRENIIVLKRVDES